MNHVIASCSMCRNANVVADFMILQAALTQQGRGICHSQAKPGRVQVDTLGSHPCRILDTESDCTYLQFHQQRDRRVLGKTMQQLSGNCVRRLWPAPSISLPPVASWLLFQLLFYAQLPKFLSIKIKQALISYLLLVKKCFCQSVIFQALKTP